MRCRRRQASEAARSEDALCHNESSFALSRAHEYVELAKVIDIAICPEVGPEVVMGSARMKSGTAQKLVRNMITTAAMIRMGKVYAENMMIDLRSTNLKLRERAKRIGT
ncbi:MAG: hypothetical protein MZV64_35615 [Ignavibacteriales bacterium]|nr:hypothetical protein [Ignavibacteriales bacterium]